MLDQNRGNNAVNEFMSKEELAAYEKWYDDFTSITKRVVRLQHAWFAGMNYVLTKKAEEAPMPDTSSLKPMTPAEHADLRNWPEIAIDRSKAYLRDPFPHIGQKVWFISSGRPAEIIAFGPCATACVRHPDDSLGIWNFVDLTTVDPNQPVEPVPKKCPFCKGTADLSERSTGFVFECICWFRTPMKPTRLEAIQAWNSIRVERDGGK